MHADLSEPSSGSAVVSKLTFPASFGRLGEAREMVQSAARDFGFDEATCFQIKVAVSEAVANAIEHGSPRGARDEIALTCSVEDRDFAVYVRDSGQFRHGFFRPSEDAERGRGLSFMATLMDEVDIHIERQGTLVRLAKHADGGRPPEAGDGGRPSAGPDAAS